MEKIKQLRDKTGAGMMECKKALDESGGDIDKAVEILRKSGIAKAAKRGDRETSEGVVMVGADDANKIGYILQLNSETDFVSRNDKFQDLANKIFDLIKEKKPSDLEALLASEFDNGTVKEEVDNLSGVIGEKIVISGFEILKSEGTVSAYSHMGGKIGVLIAVDKADSSDLAYDIAMQIAASNPKYLNTDEVPQEEIDKEKEIYKVQLLKEGKPENILDKILEGKINKYFEDICLVKQEFIKDDKQKVEQILGDAKIEKFVRLNL